MLNKEAPSKQQWFPASLHIVLFAAQQQTSTKFQLKYNANQLTIIIHSHSIELSPASEFQR